MFEGKARKLRPSMVKDAVKGVEEGVLPPVVKLSLNAVHQIKIS